MGDASQRTTESPRAKRGAFLPLEGATDEALDSLLVALDETKKVKKVTRGRRIKASRDLLKWKNLTDPNAIPSSSGRSVTVAATCISQGRAKDSDSRYSLSLECGTDGEVRTLRCTCPYAQKSDEGFCKHTIALIIWTCENAASSFPRAKLASSRATPAVEEAEDEPQKPNAGEAKRGRDRRDTSAATTTTTSSVQQAQETTTSKGGDGGEGERAKGSPAVVPDADGWLPVRKKTKRSEGVGTGVETKLVQNSSTIQQTQKKSAQGVSEEDDGLDDIFDDWLGLGSTSGQAKAKPKPTATEEPAGVAKKAEPAAEGEKDDLDDVLGTYFTQRKRRDEAGEPSATRDSLVSLISARESQSPAGAAKKAEPVDVTSWKDDLDEALNVGNKKKGKVSFKQKFLDLGFQL